MRDKHKQYKNKLNKVFRFLPKSPKPAQQFRAPCGFLCSVYKKKIKKRFVKRLNINSYEQTFYNTIER